MSDGSEPQPEFEADLEADYDLLGASELDTGLDHDDFDASADSAKSMSPGRKPTRKKTNALIAGILGALILGGGILATIGSPVPAGDETVYRNWSEHVEPLNEHNQSSGSDFVRHLNRGGVASFVEQLKFSADDADSETTQQVRTALARGDDDAAAAAVVEAQQIPDLTAEQQEIVQEKTGAPAPKPEISIGMKEALVAGDAEMFHIHLYDSCDEDGDIVEVRINGQPFAVVPITHRGATLSVPIQSGQSTTVELRGVRDGGGGITVACRTSEGDFFVKSMYENEVQTVGVVR